jgi:hypothetical protein
VKAYVLRKILEGVDDNSEVRVGYNALDDIHEVRVISSFSKPLMAILELSIRSIIMEKKDALKKHDVHAD